MQWALLATKFHRPVTPAKQVHRQHLIERLNEGMESGRILTLISAPAGFGKTSCANAWIDHLDRLVTWLSLDPSDDDPGRFFTYFIAALQRMDERTGKEIQAVLNTGQFPPAEAIATVLINDIQGIERKFLFVLDDFHLIQDRFILQVIEKIIANQPGPMHLVLITREDPLLPLARLRANSQMTEIRAMDLRFSGAEISQLLQDVIEVPLSDADIAALEQRTEGWVAGLQLAGLSMRGRKDLSSFITNLTGSHRYILNYLTEEVLNRQPEEIRNFLLQTSILEKLNGELCDVVTSRSGSEILLERLFNANLFLIPLDDDAIGGAGAGWYRYHHLFGDLLRSLMNRLPRAQISQLHQRASRWYAAAGMVSEAIEHALAAEDYQQAVALMERQAMSFVMQGYIKTVERWFQAIPQAWHLKSPRANIALAGMYLMRGNYSLTSQYLQQAEAALRSPEFATEATTVEAESLRAEWFALQSNLCNIQGKAVKSVEMAQQALKMARPDDFYIRGVAYQGLGGAYRLSDDYPKLVEAYQNAIRSSRMAGNSLSEMLSATALVLMAIQHGQLRFAEEVAAEVIRHIDASGSPPPPVAGAIYGALGKVYYEWNQLEQARSYYQQGMQLSQFGGHNAGVVFGWVLLSQLDQADGKPEKAAQEIQEAVDLLPRGVPAWLKPEVTLQQVRIELSKRNLAAVEAVLNQLGIDWHAPIDPQAEIYFLAYLYWLLHQAQAKQNFTALPQGIEIASRLIEGARQAERTGILLQALLLRAQLHAALKDRDQALNDLALALKRAEPEGFIRTFVDEGPEIAALLKDWLSRSQPGGCATQLLRSFSISAAGSPPADMILNNSATARAVERAGLAEPLTERELAVLRLVAEGLKYEQIAEQLVISLNTVRFYIKEIYGKLQVNNRMRAVEVARQHGLL